MTNAAAARIPSVDRDRTSAIIDDLVEIMRSMKISTENIGLTTKFEDIGVDSLTLVEFVFAIDEKFDIELPYQAAAKTAPYETVLDVVEAIDREIAAKA